MEYKVVPITPVQKNKEDITHIAQELESLIKKHHTDGWEYVRIESLKVWVNPIGGCFGFGTVPGYYAEKQMMIFKK